MLALHGIGESATRRSRLTNPRAELAAIRAGEGEMKTTNMHKMAGYNYFGVIEEAYRHGERVYISIIDHRLCDAKLDGIYDELGVRRVDRQYLERWAEARGLTLK